MVGVGIEDVTKKTRIKPRGKGLREWAMGKSGLLNGSKDTRNIGEHVMPTGQGESSKAAKGKSPAGERKHIVLNEGITAQTEG